VSVPEFQILALFPLYRQFRIWLFSAIGSQKNKITCSSRTPYFFTKSAVSAANARASAETELNGISSFCCFRRADSNLFESR